MYLTIFRVYLNALLHLNLRKPQDRQERDYTHILDMVKPKKMKVGQEFSLSATQVYGPFISYITIYHILTV